MSLGNGVLRWSDDARPGMEIPVTRLDNPNPKELVWVSEKQVAADVADEVRAADDGDFLLYPGGSLSLRRVVGVHVNSKGHVVCNEPVEELRFDDATENVEE